MEFQNNAYFWQKIDTLVYSSDLVIERPKGSTHPLYQNIVYPVDYGNLRGAKAGDKEFVDVFVGSQPEKNVTSILVCADILKKDLEVKLVIGCTDEEENNILQMLNQTDYQKCVIMHRGNDIPAWASAN